MSLNPGETSLHRNKIPADLSDSSETMSTSWIRRCGKPASGNPPVSLGRTDSILVAPNGSIYLASRVSWVWLRVSDSSYDLWRNWHIDFIRLGRVKPAYSWPYKRALTDSKTSPGTIITFHSTFHGRPGGLVWLVGSRDFYWCFSRRTLLPKRGGWL